MRPEVDESASLPHWSGRTILMGSHRQCVHKRHEGLRDVVMHKLWLRVSGAISLRPHGHKQMQEVEDEVAVLEWPCIQSAVVRVFHSVQISSPCCRSSRTVGDNKPASEYKT